MRKYAAALIDLEWSQTDVAFSSLYLTMVLNSGNYILVTKSDKMFVNFSIICCLTDREDDILNFNLPAGKSFLNVTHMVNFQLCVSYCRVQPGSTEQNFHHGPERTGANRIHKRSPLFYS